MLIRFAVENFLSFKELTEFTMTAGKMTRHKDHFTLCNGRRVLKGAFVFGANASGKTNLIRAVAFASNIIENGLENTNCDKKYFRIDNAWRNKPTVFQFDIFSNNHFYSYGFAVSLVNRSIEEEWLYQIDDEDKCIFLRSKEDDGTSYKVYSDLVFDTELKNSRFTIYAESICNIKMDKTLFLSDIVQRIPDSELEYQPFKDVMSWFDRLIVIFPDSRYEGIIHLIENDNERVRLENLLNYFDTGVSEVIKKNQDFEQAFTMFPEKVVESLKTSISKRLKDEEFTAATIGNDSRIQVTYENGDLIASKVFTNHGNDDDLFEYYDESDGTQRLFDLIPIFQNVLNNSVILIDEIDRSLHTKAVMEFISYFYSVAEKSASQLIVTTHDSNILDLDFVRQDEIWFIERQRDQSSRLYSLNQFKERFDKRIEKEYLIGRYGAIPIFRHSAFESKLLREDDIDANSCQ